MAAAFGFGLLTTGADAYADAKQECAAAYEKTQSLRDNRQLIEARKQALACSASTCSTYVTKDCLQWFTEIDALVPTVIFTAQDDAGSDTLAVRVTVDGQPAAEKLDGKAVPLDPGMHTVRFEMTGSDAKEQKVILRQGEKNRKLAVSFKKPPPAAPPLPLPAIVPPPTLPTPEQPTAPPAPLDKASTVGVPLWAWIAGGAGVVASGFSVGFGVSAHSADEKVTSICGDAAQCYSTPAVAAKPYADQRTLHRTAAILLGAAGMVGIVASVIGIVKAPSRASSPRTSFVLAPFGSPSAGGLEIQGQF